MKNTISTTSDEFLKPVKHKSCIATFYHTKDRDSYRYEVRYHDADGLRQRATFLVNDKATEFAQAIVREMASGGLDVLSLRGQERRVCEHATEMLRPFSKDLDETAAQFVEAHEMLKDHGSWREAVEFFLVQRPRIPSIPVSTAVDEFIESRRANGVGQLYLRDLRTRLGHFAEAFRCPVSLVRTPELVAYIENLKSKKHNRPAGQRTKKNHLYANGTLLEYCKVKGYLHECHPGIANIPKPCLPAEEVVIYTPNDMANLLKWCQPLYLACAGTPRLCRHPGGGSQTHGLAPPEMG